MSGTAPPNRAAASLRAPARNPRRQSGARLAVLILALALALAVGATASANDDDGITLDFPDAPHRFAPVPEGAGFSRFSMLDAVGVEGAAGPARLVIELALAPDSTPGAAPLEARLTFRPDGFRDFWQTPGPVPEGAVTLTRVDLRGPRPRIAGQFAVTLCRRASVTAPPDTGDCHPATGTFDMALTRD